MRFPKDHVGRGRDICCCKRSLFELGEGRECAEEARDFVKDYAEKNRRMQRPISTRIGWQVGPLGFIAIAIVAGAGKKGFALSPQQALMSFGLSQPLRSLGDLSWFSWVRSHECAFFKAVSQYLWRQVIAVAVWIICAVNIVEVVPETAVLGDDLAGGNCW